MAKKSSGGALGWIALIVLGVIASVPASVWIVLIVIVVVGYVIYALLNHTTNKPDARSTYAEEDEPQAVRPVPPRVAYGISRGAPDHSLTSAACWVSPGKSCAIDQRIVPGGMIYVGSRLPAVGTRDVEPAAIDPTLPIRRIGRAPQMPYWPNYSSIAPEARGEFLDWLGAGRRDPDVQIGCVFLFLYGLERRCLHDVRTHGAEVASELPAIAAEVEALLALYVVSGSFQGYASGLLDTIKILSSPTQNLYTKSPPPAPQGRRRLQMSHKLALGQAARDGVPLPAAWALSWLQHDEMTVWRRPAERCPAEFQRLFLAMYNQQYGAGMKLPANRTRLKLAYRPASASFAGQMEHDPGNIPDVTVLERPINELRKLASEASELLDSYSRFVGRNPHKHNSMDAVVLLPPLLWPRDSLISLGTWLKQLGVEREMQASSLTELMRHFPEWGTINKERAGAFAAALEHFGVCMEPDVRWGGPVPAEGDPVVLFSVPADERGKKPTPVYAAAALTMHLAVTVATSDGISANEEQHLEASLEQLLHLAGHERLRLRAHLKWLLLSKPSLTAMKKRVEGLDKSQREAIGAFTVSVAQAQGGLTPTEMKTLGKIYRLLNLPEDRLFSMAHSAATEPVPVQTPQKTSKKFAVPRPPVQASGNVLDAKRIAQLNEESARVSAILTTIFAEDGQAESNVEAEPENDPVPASPMGFDRETQDFCSVLTGRDSWSRKELEDLAADRGLLLDGALERVNEAYIDKYNEPLLEGEDPVTINKAVLKEPEPV